MDYWTDKANDLETALRGKPDALLLHCLRYATPQDLKFLAGPVVSGMSPNVLASVVTALRTRLTDSGVIACEPQASDVHPHVDRGYLAP
jgi:hypothetical protein